MAVNLLERDLELATLDALLAKITRGQGQIALEMAGDWRGAADAWEQLGCPYERAMALLEGDETAQRTAKPRNGRRWRSSSAWERLQRRRWRASDCGRPERAASHVDLGLPHERIHRG